MGELGYERAELDFYPTPSWVTDAISPQVLERLTDYGPRGGLQVPRTIWEPACGDGAMSRRLEENFRGLGIKVLASDIVDRGAGEIRDFLDVEKLDGALSGVRGIVTNPPYGRMAETFTAHALKLMKPVQGFVAMLLRHEWDCAKERQHLLGMHKAYAHKMVLTSRPRWIADSTGSPRHNYAWFIWDWKTVTNAERPTIGYHVREGKGD